MYLSWLRIDASRRSNCWNSDAVSSPITSRKRKANANIISSSNRRKSRYVHTTDDLTVKYSAEGKTNKLKEKRR